MKLQSNYLTPNQSSSKTRSRSVIRAIVVNESIEMSGKKYQKQLVLEDFDHRN